MLKKRTVPNKLLHVNYYVSPVLPQLLKFSLEPFSLQLILKIPTTLLGIRNMPLGYLSKSPATAVPN